MEIVEIVGLGVICGCFCFFLGYLQYSEDQKKNVKPNAWNLVTEP